MGYIINFAYNFTGSYGLAIVLFAVVVRVLALFPVGILAHNNSIRLLKLRPGLDLIKRRYAGDKERLNEEQYSLFKKERYSPFLGLIPLFVQLLLIIGIMQVILDPSRHLHGITTGDINFMFLGLDLLMVPSLFTPSPELIMPLLSVGAAVGYCLVQNAVSPGALSQSKSVNMGMTIVTVSLSLYLTLVLPVGVGLYWTVSTVTGTGMVLLLNLLYSPKKLAPEAIAYLESIRKSPEELKAGKERIREHKLREKRDTARFTGARKELVFYALTSGQYKFYKKLVEFILDNSDIIIHYLTNDPDDALFKQENPRLIPYYASQRRTVSLMLKLDADILVTTVPDLQSYHMKRSVVRSGIEYIYTHHGISSGHLVLREKALDHFNTIFCVGPHQVDEVRRREQLAGLPAKKLVKAGYGLYDQLIESFADASSASNEKPQILIAPSWQADNIMELCINEVIASLLGNGFKIVVRPHPQFINMFGTRIDALRKRFSRQELDGEIVFELDFSDNSSIFMSDVLITDWSNIAYEFSFCTLKPSLFINTPMKVMNPNYKQYDLEVLDISLRGKLGVSVDTDKVDGLGDVVAGLIDEKDKYRNKIEEIVKQYIFYPGRNGEAGGKYVIKQLRGGAD